MSVSEDQSSTHNHSKTTFMEGNPVNYHQIDLLDDEVDQARVKSFKPEMVDAKAWPYKSKISTTHDKHTRSQYQVNASHTKLSYGMLAVTSKELRGSLRPSLQRC